eukprot:881367-Pleurochrysis_carterae.AAC.2
MRTRATTPAWSVCTCTSSLRARAQRHAPSLSRSFNCATCVLVCRRDAVRALHGQDHVHGPVEQPDAQADSGGAAAPAVTARRVVCSAWQHRVAAFSIAVARFAFSDAASQPLRF